MDSSKKEVWPSSDSIGHGMTLNSAFHIPVEWLQRGTGPHLRVPFRCVKHVLGSQRPDVTSLSLQYMHTADGNGGSDFSTIAASYVIRLGSTRSSYG
jgi:hypothetical protein